MDYTVTLASLVGTRRLSGVDTCIRLPIKKYDFSKDTDLEDSEAVAFVLDGKTYIAAEDPSDDYRSCMRPFASDDAYAVKNVFAACDVLCRMEEKEPEVMEMIDTTTGKVVLRIGTANADDYYPWYVAEFTPENMAVNAKR